MTVTTPDWVRHAVFYEIFPDRFAKSDAVHKPSNLEPWDAKPTNYGFKGGDLVGIAEKLDYLQDLGVTALYFCPIFASTANHRYHTHDYFTIDPILGGTQAFRQLLDSAHARDIKVVIDGVFNHASRGFYQFNHALENGAASPYLDWFHIHGFPLHAYEGKHTNYDAWWGIPALPKLNTDTPAVRDFIFEVAEYWIKFGCDGWRLDVPGEINDDSFWQEFRARVKAINPEAYIVGEIWHEGQRWLKGDQFDAIMNYQFTKACIGFFAGDKRDEHLLTGAGYAPVTTLDAQSFAYSLNVNLGLYDKAINDVQLNLLDSHDTARFLSIVKHDQSALKLATLTLMTYPGAPCVYYGNEIGLDGGKDPDCRKAFPWDKSQWDTALRAFFKTCIALRKKYRALRDGSFNVVYAEDKCLVYVRSQGDEKLVIAINSGAAAATINVVVNGMFQDGQMLQTVLGKKASYTVGGGRLTGITLPKREGIVLRLIT